LGQRAEGLKVGPGCLKLRHRVGRGRRFKFLDDLLVQIEQLIGGAFQISLRPDQLGNLRGVFRVVLRDLFGDVFRGDGQAHGPDPEIQRPQPVKVLRADQRPAPG